MGIEGNDTGMDTEGNNPEIDTKGTIDTGTDAVAVADKTEGMLEDNIGLRDDDRLDEGPTTTVETGTDDADDGPVESEEPLIEDEGTTTTVDAGVVEDDEIVEDRMLLIKDDTLDAELAAVEVNGEDTEPEETRLLMEAIALDETDERGELVRTLPLETEEAIEDKELDANTLD